jgi:UDP-glucose 4-epimerase
MAVLVTGGAGYIGSITVELLAERGEKVVVLDDVARGHRASLDPKIPFYEGKTGDRELVGRICREHGVESCIHFAALTYVGESVQQPAAYYENNISQGLRLLDALIEAGAKRLVFSSSAATYGEPREVPIPETHPQWPTNPYGWSKLFMERILHSCDTAYGFKFVALRYFNAAGATATRGEDHDPETHIIPNVLRAAIGKLPHVSVFGNTYPTPDGTCIRDYIHVVDLADAHIRALQHLRSGGSSECFNCGTGRGYSVLELIETAKRITGRDIPVKMEPPRAGDPSRLIAQADKARRVLGWAPKYPELADIIRTAWEWHQAHPQGYGPAK